MSTIGLIGLPNTGERYYLIIPCERMLWRYWDEHGDFRSAFVQWAEELTAGYDAWADRGFDEPPVIDMQAVAAALNSSQDSNEFFTSLGALLKPYHGDGTTFRELARASELPLRLIVGACWKPCDDSVARRYADLEEDLIANGAPSGLAALQRKHGFASDGKQVRGLAARHGIDLTNSLRGAGAPPAPDSPHSKNNPFPRAVRQAAIRLMFDEGMKPSEARRVLLAENPYLSTELLYVWKKRETQRRDQQEARAAA